MGLRLQHARAEGELGGGRFVLVLLRERADEGGVVRADGGGYGGVAGGAVGGRAVAELGGAGVEGGGEGGVEQEGGDEEEV